MSEKIKYDSGVPWDRMTPEDAAEVAKIQAKGSVGINFAVGVTSLIISVTSIITGEIGKARLQSQIDPMAVQITQLSSTNNSLEKENYKLRLSMESLRADLAQKELTISGMKTTEQNQLEEIISLRARIEELETILR